MGNIEARRYGLDRDDFVELRTGEVGQNQLAGCFVVHSVNRVTSFGRELP